LANLLLVEDEEHFRDAMTSMLKTAGHTVVIAANGKVAREILGTQNFDGIISDLQMPHMDGLELLDWVKQKKPTKFLLMTGFSHLLETKDAFARGADEFLAKPFKVEDLNIALDSLFKTSQVKEQATTASPKYCKVSIEEFVAKPTIEFDLYVRLTEKKYVKIGHAGATIPREQIETLYSQRRLFKTGRD
jgi:DNA-binding NtrC family response regulator